MTEGVMEVVQRHAGSRALEWLYNYHSKWFSGKEICNTVDCRTEASSQCLPCWTWFFRLGTRVAHPHHLHGVHRQHAHNMYVHGVHSTSHVWCHMTWIVEILVNSITFWDQDYRKDQKWEGPLAQMLGPHGHFRGGLPPPSTEWEDTHQRQEAIFAECSSSYYCPEHGLHE